VLGSRTAGTEAAVLMLRANRPPPGRTRRTILFSGHNMQVSYVTVVVSLDHWITDKYLWKLKTSRARPRAGHQLRGDATARVATTDAFLVLLVSICVCMSFSSLSTSRLSVLQTLCLHARWTWRGVTDACNWKAVHNLIIRYIRTSSYFASAECGRMLRGDRWTAH
jgi:hypothetical protein